MLGRFIINRKYTILLTLCLLLSIILPGIVLYRFIGAEMASIKLIISWIGGSLFVFLQMLTHQILAQQDGLYLRWFFGKKQFIPWANIKKIKFSRGRIYFEQNGKLHYITVSSHLNNYMALMELIQTYAPNVEMDIDFYRYMEQGHCEPHAFRIWFTGIYLLFTLFFLWRFIVVLNGPVFDWILLLSIFLFYVLVIPIHNRITGYRQPQKSVVVSYCNITFIPIIVFLTIGMGLAIEAWVYLITGLVILIAIFLMLVSFNERISNRKLLQFSGVCLLFGMVLYANVLWSRYHIEIKPWVILPERIMSIIYTQDGSEVCVKSMQSRMSPSGKTEFADYQTNINLTTNAITSTLYDFGSRPVISPAPDGKKLAYQLSYNRGSTIDLYIRDTGMKAKERIARVEKKDKTEIQPFISRQSPEIQWSPDSRYLAFWEQNSDSNKPHRRLSIYDTESKQKKNLIQIDTPSDRIFWMNDSTIRYLTYQLMTVRRKDTVRYYTLWDLNIYTIKPIAIYKSKQNWGWHEVYHNGKYLLVVEPYSYNWSEGTSYIYTMDSFNRYAISTTYNIAFHPKEDRLIFREDNGKNTQIIEYTISSQQRRVIISEPGEIRLSGYSPSGIKIAYAVQYNIAAKALYVIDSDGNNKRKIISLNVFTFVSNYFNDLYAWAPDGNQMVIASDILHKDLYTRLSLVNFK